jgi:hypothetical protein
MQHFFDQDGINVGDCHAVQGMMDCTTYNLWGMKEPDYVMRMMATGRPLRYNKTCMETVHHWTEGGAEVSRWFQYTCSFDWHFLYWHSVDNHNNLWHELPSIEDSWITHRGEICVFSFLLAFTKVNAFLCLRYFTFAKGTIAGCPTLQTFWHQLAWQMINNTWIQSEEKRAHEVGIALVHQLMTMPPPCKCFLKSSVDLYCSVEAPSVHVQALVWKKDQNLLCMSTRELALLQLLPKAR